MTITRPYNTNYEQVENGQAIDSEYICHAFSMDYRVTDTGKSWKAGQFPKKTYLGSTTGSTWQEAELNAVKQFKDCHCIETWNRKELVSSADASLAGR